MDPWPAQLVVLLGSVAMVVIRAPYGQRSRSVKVVASRRTPLETLLVTLAWIGFFVPLLWVATPLLAAADYPLHPLPFALGTALMVVALWLFQRSHRDLGSNWSITLELRERHQLVTAGVYRRLRHPMYSSFLLYALGQALVLPNWLAGPAYLVTLALLVALRLGPEERMMLEAFGADYEAYRRRSKRLLPGVW